MVEIIGVRFKSGGKQYYFDPAGLEVQPGQGVIVETSRGLEYGECAQGNTQVEEETVVQPLRPLVRIATEEDEKTVEKNREKEAKAFQICQEKIAAHGLEMKLVEAEYSFEGNKVLFFFTAEGRVDFRALVKDLASTIHARIELRQIGVRDEAKMLGGLGICGRPFCCAQFLDEFQPVSIKMAKTQNLSLNPTKISGTCGRLMCCLKYEQEAYEDLVKHTPKQESFVETPDGAGTVSSVNLLRQQVQVRLDSAPDTPKCYHNCEICVVRNGKGKRPEGYVEPPLEELAKLRRAPEPEAAPEPTSSNPLAAALEAVFNGERPPEPEGERPRGEGEGRRRRRRGGRSEGASGGESRSQGEGQQRSRREWERRLEKPRDKEPGTAEAEGVQEGGERKPSRRRRRRPRGNRPAPGPEGNG
ncbi:stage 0 sporulation family protein [Clostridium sp. DFI.5.61]|jgi:cell fate regulator YaaT (PSP1 superfamily)|uniref:PSP1 domain-containing protein n=1 Tax=Clostridium TaxID=1485 RepID=UPI00210AAB4B|nr:MULTISPECIES: stage 0 sporulation family protein [Clostridium]MBS5506222.1 stage 0 sporulation family protein [Oscillospiraceae bacterium]MCB5927071.1 stage 0 sporulation family protein [bacterium 210820-DFI.5.26]MCQ5160443.1 stage 0 sporulation family protein [Clostridium sp. DFI.5.61]